MSFVCTRFRAKSTNERRKGSGLQKSGRTAPSELSVLTSYNLLLLVNVVFNVSERERERERKRTVKKKKRQKTNFLIFFSKFCLAFFWLFFRFCFSSSFVFLLYLVLGDVIFVSNHQTLRRRRRS
jgi:hypothetical protein